MYRRSTRFILGALALIGMAAVPAHAENTVQIAVTGLYEWDWQIKPGGDWWGIFPDEKGGYILRPTRVSAVADHSMVTAPQRAPRQIHVQGESGSVIVFRGLMSAALGPLKTVKLAEYPAPLVPGEHYDLRWELETPETRLRLLAAGRLEGEQVAKYHPRRVDDYELWLQRGSGESRTMQLLLKESEESGNETAYLRWAGDLDRDGQLDLIYDFGRHHTETRLAPVFRSETRRTGGLVAQWNGTCGC